MSKTELLQELEKLPPAERTEIFEALWKMEQLHPGEPTEEEKALLDAEWADYLRDGKRGIPWEEVEAKLRKKT
jgi:putative addiction module component (TIGR02574 family)